MENRNTMGWLACIQRSPRKLYRLGKFSEYYLIYSWLFTIFINFNDLIWFLERQWSWHIYRWSKGSLWWNRGDLGGWQRIVLLNDCFYKLFWEENFVKIWISENNTSIKEWIQTKVKRPSSKRRWQNAALEVSRASRSIAPNRWSKILEISQVFNLE